MLAFQLWVPKGWDGIIIATEIERGILKVENVHIGEPYRKSHWGNMLDLKKLNPSELGPLIDGTLMALESPWVPVKNPFQFLEIGLQTASNHIRAGALLWTMGLDALLAAEKQGRFASRLKRLLGETTPVFPEDWVGRRPVYTIANVAANMYDLRNLIAHGKEILKKYREQIDFKFEPAELQYLNVENWTYEVLLYESSLFTFIAALRKVITDGHLATIPYKRVWEAFLDQQGAALVGG